MHIGSSVMVVGSERPRFFFSSFFFFGARTGAWPSAIGPDDAVRGPGLPGSIDRHNKKKEECAFSGRVVPLMHSYRLLVGDGTGDMHVCKPDNAARELGIYRPSSPLLEVVQALQARKGGWVGGSVLVPPLTHPHPHPHT